jgi:LPXTG-motif cell wall-anchored protein
MLATLPAVPFGPVLSPRAAGLLFLVLGLLLLAGACLLRRQRREHGDEQMRLVEGVLMFFAGVCFALARHYLG